MRGRMRGALCGLVVAVGASTPLSGQADAACRPVPGPIDASERLGASLRAMGVPDEGVLTLHARGRWSMDFQSDRTYPPFFSAFIESRHGYDVATRAERVAEDVLFPRGGPPPRTFVVDDRSTWLVTDTAVVEAPAVGAVAGPHRLMNPWAVVGDWAAGGGVRAVALCPYRDDDRLVLEREGAHGTERLFLDVESGFPVKLDRTVPDATWGQRHEEVLWSTWIETGAGGALPSASFILRDGRVWRERTVGEVEVVDAAADPVPDLPEPAGAPPPSPLDDPERMRPDTVRLGDGAYLLAHPFYNEAVVAAADTVWVLDATLGEARAREDAARIRRLFGPDRPVAVVVTDLAWPHVGGVRWWVAEGATIVAHRSAEDFLRSLVERRWTLEPDALERRRADGPVPFRFVPVHDGGLDAGGGRLAIRPIDGVSSEGALMAYDRGTRFLWAGDWIQFTDRPSRYASEVTAAAAREGIEPLRVGAQHIPVTPWRTVLELNPVR